jgi:N-acetylmuramoyl-L-alanine amidase
MEKTTTEPMRKIDYIVIHCTAGGKNQTIESIRSWWHSDPPRGLGWKNVGYHYLVMGDGLIVKLADIDKVTNGVAGFNSNSVHISYTGGMTHDDRTEQQKAALLDCIHMVISQCASYGYKPKIQGHRDFPNVRKACPQFDAIKEYEWIII